MNATTEFKSHIWFTELSNTTMRRQHSSYFFVHSFAVAKNLVLSVLSSWGARSGPESKDNSYKELPLQYRVQTGHRGSGYWPSLGWWKGLLMRVNACLRIDWFTHQKINWLKASTNSEANGFEKKLCTKWNTYFISQDRDTYSTFLVDSGVVNLCRECHLAWEELVKRTTSSVRWVKTHGRRLEWIILG